MTQKSQPYTHDTCSSYIRDNYPEIAKNYPIHSVVDHRQLHTDGRITVTHEVNGRMEDTVLIETEQMRRSSPGFRSWKDIWFPEAK